MITQLENKVDLDIIRSIDVKSLQERRQTLNQPTGRFFHDPWVIKSEYKGTIWDEILSKAPNDIGEARIMRLVPGETYFAHADLDDRYHLSIYGNLDYLIDLENKEIIEVPEDGHFYYMDAGRIHSAVNWGSESRYHLVIRKLLLDFKIEESRRITLTPINPPIDFRFKFDNHISNHLNRMIKNKMITDVYLIDQSISFIIDSRNISLIKNLVIQAKLEMDVNIS